MKKVLTILVLIMLIISFFQITSMYALYKEQIEGDYTTLLGVWAIKVNDVDISSGGQDLKFTIENDQLGYVNSGYIQAGKIAPDGQAYFDILVDPSNTDVSLVYTINIGTDTTGIEIVEDPEGTGSTSQNELVELTDVIELISVENKFVLQSEDGQETQITNEEQTNQDGNSYIGIMPVDKITEGYKNSLRIYFKWKNVEVNNESDKLLGETAGAKILPSVQINIKQYTGEVISNGS